MTTTQSAAPLRRIAFRDGSYPETDPPANTMDPRYRSCTDHHTACDCREAELNEERAEYKSMYSAVVDAAKRVLAGHPTYRYTEVESERSGSTYEAEGCMCTGCQIVRAVDMGIGFAVVS